MKWRLIVDGPLAPAWNMAVDEAIMMEHGRGKSPPTLRFYFWDPPTLSLGYFQDLAREVDLAACQQSRVSVVRRPTGGRAVLHHREVTYSVVTGTKAGASPTILTSYQWISDGLACGLEKLGARVERYRPVPGQTLEMERPVGSAACFDSPSWYEITVGGKKVIGSAQVRRDQVLLQHGSILLNTQAGDLFRLLRFENEETRLRMQRLFEKKASGLRESLRREVVPGEVITAMTEGFSEGMNLDLERGSLTPEEKEQATRLVAEKYANQEWILQRGRKE